MIRLDANDTPRLISFLQRDISSNVYLLGVLDRISRGAGGELGHFYALEDDGDIGAVVYCTYGGLLVPYAPNPDDAGRIGSAIRRNVTPRMLVGPREATDALWEGFGQVGKPRLFRGHQLYSLARGDLALAGGTSVRRALPRDLDLACDTAALMQTEELGIDPRELNYEQFRRRIARLIHEDVFYVLPLEDVFAFQAAAGTWCPDGVQIEAVYTPPTLRGRGWATKGLAAMCADLLERHPLITLHVNERNSAAVSLYDRLGFTAETAFRLISF